MRIRIQHFKSMQIPIRGFDDRKLEKFTAEKELFCDKKSNLLIPVGSIKDA
jgi:hypothetical protein